MANYVPIKNVNEFNFYLRQGNWDVDLRGEREDREIVVWFYRISCHEHLVQDVKNVAGISPKTIFLAVDLDVNELGQHFRVQDGSPKFKVYTQGLLNAERKVRRKRKRIRDLIRNLNGVSEVDRKVTDLADADDDVELNFYVVDDKPKGSKDSDDIGIAVSFLPSGDSRAGN